MDRILFLYFGIFYLSVSVVSRKDNFAPKITEQPIPLIVLKDEPASLRCRADARPAATIRWYKDGQPYQGTSSDDGDLFFLKVTNNQNTGVYYCVATNFMGSARSDNATLEVAFLKSEFKKHPQDVEAISGGTYVLECTPPRAYPVPIITWEKDRKTLVSDGDRVQIVQDGNLMIRQVREEDAGSYVCIAKNMANTRKSNAGVLSVVTVPDEGPTFSCSPVDKMVHIGNTITFCCQVDAITGATQPTISWHKRNQAPIYPGQNNGRRSVLEDGSFQIRDVTNEDEGFYFCTVDGRKTISAQAYLRVVDSVELPPIIRTCPYNQTLSVSTSNVWLKCEVDGTPQPEVEWLKDGEPMSQNIRIYTLSSGSLQISDLGHSDTGRYTCVATSENGETRCSAELTVTDRDGNQHPRPADSEFPGVPGIPTAQNTSNGHVVLAWSPPTSTSRPSLLLYRIEAYNHDIDATWEILANNIQGTSYMLQYLRPVTTYVFFVRAINAVGPGGPSSVSNPFTTGDTTIIAGPDTSNRRVVVSSVKVLSPTAFKIIWEFICPQASCTYNVKYRKTNDEDITMQESAERTSKIVTGLSPGTSYTISVQPVINSVHGSDSEEVSKRTLDQGEALQPAQTDTVIQDYLDDCNIQIKSLTAESNTSVRVQWKIGKNIHYVDGAHIRYHPVAEDDEYMVQTATKSQENITIGNLKPFTEYKVSVIAFFDNSLGESSNEERVKTKSGVPAIAPQDVYALQKNTTTIMVGWKQIQSWHVPGQITEYLVMCVAENPQYSKNVTVSGMTDYVLVTGLQPGIEYRVQVMASTETGAGPVSAPVNIVGETPIEEEPGNFSPLILGVVVGAFIVIFSCFIFFLCKWRQAKKNSDIEYKGPVSQDNSDIARHVQPAYGHTTTHQQTANWHNPQEDFYSQTHGSDSLHSSMEQYAETGMVVMLPNSNMFSNIDPTAGTMKTYSRNGPEYAVVENAGSPPATPHSMQTLPYPPRNHNYPIEFNRTTSLPPHMTQPYASTTLVIPATMREYQERQQSRGNSSNSEHSGSSRSAFKKQWNGELDNGGFSSSGGSVPPPLPPDRLGTLGSCMSECTCTTNGILTDSGGSSIDERGNRRRRTYPRGHKLPAPNITELLPPPPEHPPPSDIESAFGSHHTLPSSHHHGATIPMSSNPVTQPHITTNPLSQMDIAYNKNYGPLPIIQQIQYPESNSDNNASPVIHMHHGSDSASDCNNLHQRDSVVSPTTQNICNLHMRQSPHNNVITNHQVFEDPRHAELGQELLQFNDDVSQSEAMSDNEDLRPVIPATCRLKQTPAGPGLSLGLTNGIGYTRGATQSYPYLSEMSEVSESEMSAKDDETDLESNCTDSMMASWASINVSGSESSARNSRLSSSDGSFFTDTDFASALTQAAENIGIPVVSSNGVQHKNDKNKSALKNFRQRFPSDTDSCASGAEVKKKRPTPSRKKNMQEPNQKDVQSNLRNGGLNLDQIEANSDGLMMHDEAEIPPYDKPEFPSSSPSNTFNSRRSRRSDGDLEPNELTNMVELYRDMNDLGMTLTNNPLACANTSV